MSVIVKRRRFPDEGGICHIKSHYCHRTRDTAIGRWKEKRRRQQKAGEGEEFGERIRLIRKDRREIVSKGDDKEREKKKNERDVESINRKQVTKTPPPGNTPY